LPCSEDDVLEQHCRRSYGSLMKANSESCLRSGDRRPGRQPDALRRRGPRCRPHIPMQPGRASGETNHAWPVTRHGDSAKGRVLNGIFWVL